MGRRRSAQKRKHILGANPAPADLLDMEWGFGAPELNNCRKIDQKKGIASQSLY
jgi:hypothetical protein